MLLLMLKFMGKWRVPRAVTGEIIPEIRRKCIHRDVLTRYQRAEDEIERRPRGEIRARSGSDVAKIRLGS